MTWPNCVANEVNRIPSGKINPPRTAERRVDFLRQKAITNGVASVETDQLAAPNQPEINQLNLLF